MPKLIVAHPHFMYPGGASTAILETMQRLAAYGYDIHIISLRHPPGLISQFPMLEFHALGGALSSELRYWVTVPVRQRHFSSLVDRLGPDILLASVFPANYWAFFYRLRHSRVPCVWYCQEPSAFVHDWDVINGVPWPMRAAVLAANPVLQVLDRWLTHAADAIIVNSRYSARRVRRVYRRVAVPVRLGANAERFAPDTAKERMVLTVARLTRFKRIDILLAAAAILKQQGYSDVRWVIAGDGEEAAALQQRASSLALTTQVEFVGRLPTSALIDYYNRATIVAVTAIGEPFGLAPVEGMAAGAAIVCSDSGGPAETVEDGVTGLHFRSGDAQDLARQVGRLLDNPIIARAMGERGRQRVATTYTWEGTASEVHTIVSGLLSTFG